MRIVTRNAQCDLMCVGFAVDDRTGLFELFHNEGILVGDVISKEFGANGCANAFDIEQVFDRDGNSP